MKSKKKEFLRVEKDRKPLLKRIRFKNRFWRYLFEDQLSISAPLFFAASIICGAVVYLAYTMSVGSQIYAITAGLLTLTFPYLCYKTPAVMNQMVNDALSYKNFITILQSALRATNSTKEAIEIVAEEKDLAPEIKRMWN